jgi:hypothetical protein
MNQPVSLIDLQPMLERFGSLQGIEDAIAGAEKRLKVLADDEARVLDADRKRKEATEAHVEAQLKRIPDAVAMVPAAKAEAEKIAAAARAEAHEIVVEARARKHHHAAEAAHHGRIATEHKRRAAAVQPLDFAEYLARAQATAKQRISELEAELQVMYAVIAIGDPAKVVTDLQKLHASTAEQEARLQALMEHNDEMEAAVG